VARWRRPLAYLLFVLFPATAVLAVVGTTTASTDGLLVRPPEPRQTLPLSEVLATLLLATVVIVVATQLLGALAVRLNQPRVLGEITAGLLLGPSALGLVAPGVVRFLFSPDVVYFLGALAELGVIFFMFQVGRELPFSLLRGSGTTTVVVGHAGIAVPFLVGVLTAAGPLAGYRESQVPATAFVVFCGVALSITAFPVLARILVDRGLHDTRFGALGMATAGVSDATAWCVLALVVAVVHGGSAGTALRTVLLTVVLAAVMWWGLRPLLVRLARHAAETGRHRGTVMTTMLLTTLSAAAAAEAIGVGAIFGAFLAGVVAPRSAPLVEEFGYRLDGPTHWLLLPLFFATTGLAVDIWRLSTSAGWTLVVIVLAGVGGKLLGIVLPARLSGLDGSSAMGLGVMMNCRGLTEIVVLKIGLTLGVIPVDLFTVFLVMALLTTAMTGPLLDRFAARSPLTRSVSAGAGSR